MKHINDQIRLQIMFEKMYIRQEVQHTCCASKQDMQHSIFANKLQNVNLNYGKHANIDGASWLKSLLFWVLKAAHSLLATLDSM